MSKLKELDKTKVSFMAFSMNYWAMGNRVDDALHNLKIAGGSKTKYKVFMFPANCNPTVDDMGGIYWDKPKDMSNYTPKDYCVEVFSKGKFDV